MELPPEALEELRELYRQHEGVELSEAEAGEIAENILTLFRLVYKPIPRRILEDKKAKFPGLFRLLDEKQKNGLS